MSEDISQIIGIVLVKNEDCFLDHVLGNIAEFCDKIIIADNCSTDGTSEIIQHFCSHHPHADNYVIDEMKESHALIEPFAGLNNWVFAVDGDEVYDPQALALFRDKLLTGEYDNWWVIFGNVLNCIEIDYVRGRASGFLAPPCRSMTKLYNFRMIKAWKGSSGERLHGGEIFFKEGYTDSLRFNLYDEVAWEDADFRCLHTCFMQRSSLQKTWKGKYLPRPNPADIMSHTFFQKITSRIKQMVGIPESGKREWKIEKFTRGELVEKDVSMFFPKKYSRD